MDVTAMQPPRLATLLLTFDRHQCKLCKQIRTTLIFVNWRVQRSNYQHKENFHDVQHRASKTPSTYPN